MLEFPGLFIELDGRKTRLKWHQLRKSVAAPTFSPAVMSEGFELGASMELDLRVRADGGFAVLHDDTLESETDGAGTVRSHQRADMEDVHYGASGDKVILSEDLGEMLRDAHPEAVLQFDMKSTLDEVGEKGLQHLERIIGAHGSNIIISGEDLDLIAAVREAIPNVARGIDPTPEIFAAWRDDGASKAQSVLEAALAGPAQASTCYLHYLLILRAADHGIDMIRICHDAGMLVDAWTFNPQNPDQGLTTSEEHIVARLLQLRVDQITTDEAPVVEAAWHKAQVGMLR